MSDVNYNPKFEQNLYQIQFPECALVEENRNVSSIAIRAAAEDTDAALWYTIVCDETDPVTFSMFEMTSSTTVLVGKKSVEFDRELKDFYNLTVMVMDLREPVWSATVQVHVGILDVNYNVPTRTLPPHDRPACPALSNTRVALHCWNICTSQSCCSFRFRFSWCWCWSVLTNRETSWIPTLEKFVGTQLDKLSRGNAALLEFTYGQHLLAERSQLLEDGICGHHGDRCEGQRVPLQHSPSQHHGIVHSDRFSHEQIYYFPFSIFSLIAALLPIFICILINRKTRTVQVLSEISDEDSAKSLQRSASSTATATSPAEDCSESGKHSSPQDPLNRCAFGRKIQLVRKVLRKFRKSLMKIQ